MTRRERNKRKLIRRWCASPRDWFSQGVERWVAIMNTPRHQARRLRAQRKAQA